METINRILNLAAKQSQINFEAAKIIIGGLWAEASWEEVEEIRSHIDQAVSHLAQAFYVGKGVVDRASTSEELQGDLEEQGRRLMEVQAQMDDLVRGATGGRALENVFPEAVQAIENGGSSPLGQEIDDERMFDPRLDGEEFVEEKRVEALPDHLVGTYRAFREERTNGEVSFLEHMA